jgi:hypothetical protein
MLWQEMCRLEDRVVYHDTDSIIYEFNSSSVYNTKAGKVLGDWEVEHDGNPIIEFVALAPKTYAYRFLDMKNKTLISEVQDIAQWQRKYSSRFEIWEGYMYPVIEVCKVKGVKLHLQANAHINFDGLVELYRQDKVSLHCTQIQFDYDRKQGEMSTRFCEKHIVFNYEKGIISGDDRALPFGSEKYWDTETRTVRKGMPRRSEVITPI